MKWRGKKAAGYFDREITIDRTLRMTRALRARYGITRIAETTRLDRIGIPTISAIVPNSPDKIGVYNGKGVTRDAALAGALMEAIERQICARFEGIATYAAPFLDVNGTMDLRALGWLGKANDVLPARRIECVRGINLLDGLEIDVPVGVVRCPSVGEPLFYYTSTNGLASGNTTTEAVYHALMELVERHMWSRVHVLAHMWPRRLRAAAGLEIEQPDDPVAFEVMGAEEHPQLRDLTRRILAAGLRLRLLSYTERGWPHAMMARIIDPDAGELFYHLGFGCSWSPVHAALRAITEAVQVRLTDVQGAREDLGRSDEGPVRPFEHGRRPSGYPIEGRWYYEGPAGRVSFDDLSDLSGADLGIDLERALDAIRTFGETCVAYVDLSPADVPIKVARIVIPHLERTLVDGTVSKQMRTLFANPLVRFT